MPNFKPLFSLPLLAVLLAGCAQPIWGGHWKTEQKWQDYKKGQPYLENGQESQNTQWNHKEEWFVQDWVAQHESGRELIAGFYRSDILREQTARDGKPILVVGPQFYRLSGYDKRRVITSVDSVYGLSERGSVILLHDWKTRRQIGVFGKDGLQLE